jgi:hypothetical protein
MREMDKSEAARFFVMRLSAAKRYVGMVLGGRDLPPTEPLDAKPKLDRSSRRRVEVSPLRVSCRYAATEA